MAPTDQSDAFSLAPVDLKRKPVLGGRAADERALRALLGDLNNTALTGARVDSAAAVAMPPAPIDPPALGRSQGEQMPSDLPGETTHFSDPALVAAASNVPSGNNSGAADSGSPGQQPAEGAVGFFVSPAVTPPPAPPLTRLLLTGRSLAGKHFIAQQAGCVVVSLNQLIQQVGKTAFDGVTPGEQFTESVRAWGEGEVSDKHPLTPLRWLFVEAMRRRVDTGGTDQNVFGRPGYWAKVFERSLEDSTVRLAIVDVGTEAEYKALVRMGFSPYHVLCSNGTFQARSSHKAASTDAPLSRAFDANVIKQISVDRNGKKLRVIWNDNAPSPSGRFLSVPEFLAKLAPAAPARANESEVI